VKEAVEEFEKEYYWNMEDIRRKKIKEYLQEVNYQEDL